MVREINLKLTFVSFQDFKCVDDLAEAYPDKIISIGEDGWFLFDNILDYCYYNLIRENSH